jgi:hypothetical protein
MANLLDFERHKCIEMQTAYKFCLLGKGLRHVPQRFGRGGGRSSVDPPNENVT